MTDSTARAGIASTDPAVVRIGVLAPLGPPGWTHAGRHLLAGCTLAADEINAAGGIGGRPLALVVRDTAADPRKAAAAVDECVGLGVAALAGEYHSVVARAAATRAEALGLPFLCTSAVLDALVDRPASWIARLSPVQSRGWWCYADFLLDAGHRRVAVAAQESVYWAAGLRILGDVFAARGGTVVPLDAQALSPPALCDALVGEAATAVLLLVGYPEPAVSLVRAVRRDPRLPHVVIGAPAGQPEFAEWAALLGADGAAIPFLRYRSARLGPLGTRVEIALQDRLGEAPSFVAFEGYDTIVVVAALLRTQGVDGARAADAWSHVAVDGSRGRIRFSRVPGIDVWQWAWAPIEIVDRDPADPDRLRVLRAG